jgi:hypothetical protein
VALRSRPLGGPSATIARPGGACRWRWVLGQRGSRYWESIPVSAPPLPSVQRALGDLRDQPQGLHCTPTATAAFGRSADHAPPRNKNTSPTNDSIHPGCVQVSFPALERHSNNPWADTAAGGPGVRQGQGWHRLVPKPALAAPAPTRLSPRHLNDERRKGFLVPGGATRRREPAAQRCPGRTAPPPLCGLSLLRACYSRRLTCARAGGSRTPQRRRREEGCRIEPPHGHTRPGGVNETVQNRAPGLKIPPRQPPAPCLRCGARVPIWRRLWS